LFERENETIWVSKNAKGKVLSSLQSMDCHEGKRKPITIEVDGLLKSSLTEPPPHVS
jgi:hypothetical protein